MSNFRDMEHTYHTGTTSARTDLSAAAKEVIPAKYANAYRNKIANLHGTAAPVYLESLTARDGITFPTSVVEVDGGNPAHIKVIKLTNTKFVVLSNETDAKLEATVVDVKGHVVTRGQSTAGTHETTINNADTDSWDACPIGTAGTHFAVIYRDGAVDNYVHAKICSVSGTTITQGAEKTLDGTDTGVEVANCHYSICEPRAGVLFFTFHDSDTDLAAVAAPYSGVTIGTLGTQNEIHSEAPREIACCKIAEGYVFVAFSDTNDSNFLHGRVASVSATGSIGTWGTAKDLDSVGDDDFTYVSCQFVEQNKCIVFAVDGTTSDVVAIVCIVSAAATTITPGTIKVIAATKTATDVSGDMIDNTQGIIKWDEAGTHGECIRFTIATTTITIDASEDVFVDTASVGGMDGGLACTNTGMCVIAYEDADNDLGIVVGKYFENRIIDVRSATASIAYSFDLIPVFEYEATN